ncbi:hypothetical protein PDIG_17400 [Penicillium digitatum PHI26]|uniref:Uncharacterized protein n=2 Tax=Penicillium digitatum TaxID=36651 RepID=K9GV95_PEND2|nr:hypothetical protein PDIP_55300 [Penicillium digitatum Pd1]EKV11709.1 hypothetical protein PDIP_55300 [Penicillium digitatum Pd1]EKV17026.1 hypothetical protein PDIG_17400 [Penicillium digitatum PHI26]
MSDTLLPPGPRKPQKICYAIPYYKPFVYSSFFITSFTFAWIAYLSTGCQMCLWIGFVTHSSIWRICFVYVVH